MNLHWWLNAPSLAWKNKKKNRYFDSKTTFSKLLHCNHIVFYYFAFFLAFPHLCSVKSYLNFKITFIQFQLCQQMTFGIMKPKYKRCFIYINCTRPKDQPTWKNSFKSSAQDWKQFLDILANQTALKKMLNLKQSYKDAIDNSGSKKTRTGPVTCKFNNVCKFCNIIYFKSRCYATVIIFLRSCTTSSTPPGVAGANHDMEIATSPPGKSKKQNGKYDMIFETFQKDVENLKTQTTLLH